MKCQSKPSGLFINKVSSSGKIYQCTISVIINGIQSIATNKCRKKYNQGNPINVVKFNLN
jgi:hypothetical protein